MLKDTSENNRMTTLEIADALWAALFERGHDGLELEFRLGHVLSDGSFSPNIGKAQFDTLKAQLDAGSFDRIVHVETLEKIGSVKHVTTLAFSDGVGSPPLPPEYCMTKHRVFQTNFPVDTDSDSTPYVARCSIAFETVVPLQDPRARITRHKRRTRYVAKNWAFDLTEVTSNADVDSLETYEVEIELLDPETVFDRTTEHIIATGRRYIRDVVSMARHRVPSSSKKRRPDA